MIPRILPWLYLDSVASGSATRKEDEEDPSGGYKSILLLQDPPCDLSAGCFLSCPSFSGFSPISEHGGPMDSMSSLNTVVLLEGDPIGLTGES